MASWLKGRGTEIVGVVVHPPERRRFAEEVVQSTGVEPSAVFDGSRLRKPGFVSGLRELNADIGVSVSFGYILAREVLEIFPAGCINVHTGFLPYNRGAYPNVWSIVDRTPAGVAIHYIDEGIDTGDIIARRELPVEPVDTGASLFEKLEGAALSLFQETWPLLLEGRAPRIHQNPSEGTCHRVADVARIDEIDLNRNYRAGDLIDVLRARSFAPHAGAFFQSGGRRVLLSLDLRYEGDDRVNEPAERTSPEQEKRQA
ncbi:MAG: formyltransferase family protein [Thermoanaerobaculia bacterium]